MTAPVFQSHFHITVFWPRDPFLPHVSLHKCQKIHCYGLFRRTITSYTQKLSLNRSCYSCVFFTYLQSHQCQISGLVHLHCQAVEEIGDWISGEQYKISQMFLDLGWVLAYVIQNATITLYSLTITRTSGMIPHPLPFWVIQFVGR